jgi:glycolate oxidase iron-sulfur subunit
MCLPHCPTYQLSLQEAESPRGRLSLISAYLSGDLQMDTILRQHLDHCLLCRSCENVCPAEVPFAQIMDNTRAYMHATVGSGSWLNKQLLNFVSKRKYARRLVALMNRLRLARLARFIPLGKSVRIGRYLQFSRSMKPAPEWQNYYPPYAEQKFAVGLFLGCVNEFFDSKSLQDTIRVLNHLGIGVYIPDDQQCCGAMHLHAGEKQAADALYQQNIKAFNQYDIKAVISLSSACTATMIEQGETTSSRSHIHIRESLPRFTVMDVCSFLESIDWFRGKELQEINTEVLLHYPCTQKNVLKNTDSVVTLIRRIPGLSIKEFSGTDCCGAAGTYTLDNPEWSDRLRDSAADSIKMQAGIIISSNIGCILQFRDICNKNENLEVLFPINLVARSLGI